jgi:homopolymeric O-antigen transport system permease protein
MALITSSAPQVSGEHPVSLLVRSTVFNLWKSLNWAWLDTICQYRRSRIGPLWETINVLVMLIGLTFRRRSSAAA